MSMVFVELIVLVFVFVSFSWISFDFSRSLDEFLVLKFCEYMGDRSVEGEKCQFWAVEGVRGHLSLVRSLES